MHLREGPHRDKPGTEGNPGTWFSESCVLTGFWPGESLLSIFAQAYLSSLLSPACLQALLSCGTPKQLPTARKDRQGSVPSASPCPHPVHTRLIMKPIPFTSVIFIFNERDSKTITLISQIPQTVNGARGN